MSEERERLIQNIEGLFPPDSDFIETAKVGQRLLDQAERDVATWKTKPIEVLRRFSLLCEHEDNRQARVPR